MLTRVYLEGALGAKFGREWDLSVSNANDALRLIDANSPGFVAWIRRNGSKYPNYQVIVEYEDGKEEFLTEDSYFLERKAKTIRFVPILEGSGKWTNAIIGIVIIIVGLVYGFFTEDWVTAAKMIQYGSTMLFCGVVQALTTKTPKVRSTNGMEAGSILSSKAFDSLTANTEQGTPVQIVYGRATIAGKQITSTISVVDEAV